MKLQGALENPGARRVLTTLLERHHSGLDRKKPPLLRLDARRMPEFGPQRRFGEGDEAWEAIKVFSEEGLLTIDRIRKRPDTAEFECEPTVRLVLVRAEEAARLLGLSFGPDPWTIAWVEGCNDATWLPTSLKGALIARRHRIGDRSPAEILGRWQRVATEVYDELTLREVSARLFWGLSKELDDRAEFVAALRGTHGLAALPELPILLPVFLSADWQERGVLFVENLAVYAACVQGRVGAARGFSLIYLSGYRGAARRMRESDLTLVAFDHRGHRASEQCFLEWLAGKGDRTVPTFFWGDFDFSGMSILRELNIAFPRTEAWRHGYDVMHHLVSSGEGHFPEDSDKERQSDPGTTGCEYADNVLLPAMRSNRRFCDQEVGADLLLTSAEEQ